MFFIDDSELFPFCVRVWVLGCQKEAIHIIAITWACNSVNYLQNMAMIIHFFFSLFVKYTVIIFKEQKLNPTIESEPWNVHIFFCWKKLINWLKNDRPWMIKWIRTAQRYEVARYSTQMNIFVLLLFPSFFHLLWLRVVQFYTILNTETQKNQ